MMVLKIVQYFSQNIEILVSNTNEEILSWKSKGCSGESIKSPSTSTNIFNPSLDYAGSKIRVEFKEIV